MKLYRSLLGRARKFHARHVDAFTLVEIAIALAIIGFALVAIIGILPAGLNVQKENREETIMNQEASIWMNAIRQGAEGMDYLVDYVDGIEVTTTELDADGLPIFPPVAVDYFTPTWSSLGPDYELISGFRIVGLLSWPKYEVNGAGIVYSNSVVAYVRAISGAATEKAPQDNQTVRESAFSYRLTSEVVPFFSHLGMWTNYVDFVLNADDYSRNLARNAHDVRLEFSWPLRPPEDDAFDPPVATRVGNGHLTFRALLSGPQTHQPDPITGVSNYFVFFQPGTFKRAGGGP